ncbi:hypothetical protein [Lacisediminimonas sp.]|uniref:hypothetical protein n=1 Tax=Lacisediminimonas sp. TaxID=3060582 RepID=UPI002715B12E|nr:hypothetical protein [Lacisediminimonas sp.]MDO8300961.1 hypothetical protein [Lacisediminimonas sp.]
MHALSNTAVSSRPAHPGATGSSDRPSASVVKNSQILASVCADIGARVNSTQGLGVQEISQSPCWHDIYLNVDQAYLHHAFQQMDGLVTWCRENGIALTPRKEKAEARVHAKHAIAQANCPRVGFVDDFKVVSDFMAGRVNCSVVDIAPTVEKFRQLAEKHNGWCVVRGNGNDSYGAHRKDGSYKDIVQYLFLYLPETGHVTELQVGHTLAAVTFTVDSFLRDNRTTLPPEQLPIDLWGNKEKGTDLYPTIRDYLLLQANTPDSPDLPARRQQCLDVADRLFAGTVIPPEVKAILDSLA